MTWITFSFVERMKCLLFLLFVTSTSALSKLRRQAGYGGSAGGSAGGSYPAGSSSIVGYSGSSGSASLPGYGLGSSGGGLSGTSSFGLYGANNVIPAQNPNVFAALDQLRGSEALSATDVQSVMASAYPGTTYPTYSYIPQTSFSCSQVRQFGFYADPETRCQVFRRCEANNYMFSYLCPNGTLFNQITLVCDWWFNVNCPNSVAWVDYSNPRIYRQDLRLFDDLYGNGYGNSGLSGSSGYSSGSGGSSGSYSNGASSGSGYSSGNSGHSSGSGTGGSYGSGGGMSYGASSQVYRSALPDSVNLEAAASETRSLRELLSSLVAVKTPASAVNPSIPQTRSSDTKNSSFFGVH